MTRGSRTSCVTDRVRQLTVFIVVNLTSPCRILGRGRGVDGSRKASAS